MRKFALGSRYYFTRLSEYERKIYRQIYDCWVTGGCIAEIELPGEDFVLPSGMELHRLVQFIIDENPHIFHLETSQFYYQRRGTQVSIRADSVYSPQEYGQIYEKLLDRVDHILEPARCLRTDYEKFRYLHDYLAENVTYDRGNSDPRSKREVHTIVGPLLNSACVCDGYSRAYRLLCDQLHLSSIVAIGESTEMGNEGGHAWNFVRLEGKVYHVDVTWDSCYVATGCPVSDYYFLRNDAIFSKKHSWDRTLYPPILDDYPRKDPLLSNSSELERYICQCVNSGQKEVVLRLADSFPDAEALKRLLGRIVDRNPLVFKRIKSYSSSYFDGIKYAKINFQ